MTYRASYNRRSRGSFSSHEQLGAGAVALTVPDGVANALELLSREVIRHQPKNVALFAADYFKYLLDQRERSGVDPLLTTSANGQINTKFTPQKTDDVTDLDLANPELNNAAVKIQSSYRGFHARKDLKQQSPKSKSSGAAKSSPIKDDVSDLDLTDPELNNAAVKIQSSYRGFNARKDLKQQSPKSKSSSAAKSLPKKSKEFNSADIDPADPELNNAATKIQSNYRGFHVRKDLNDKKSKSSKGSPIKEKDPKSGSSQPAMETDGIDLADPELNDAAVKIQSGYRGFQVRKSMPGKGKTASRDGSQKSTGSKKSSKGVQESDHQGVSHQKGEEGDIVQNDEEANKAATTIQSHYKGFKTRKDMKQGANTGSRGKKH